MKGELNINPFLMNKKYSITTKTRNMTLEEIGKNIVGFDDQLAYCATEGCPRVPECAAIGEYICRTVE